MAVVALKPRRGYSFTDHATANPAAPPPGDRLDGEVDRIDRTLAQILDYLGTLSFPPPPAPSLYTAPSPVGVLGGGETHVIAGADPAATALDWAEVSAEWAEHMPDTIPPNILAVMGITGDHWSSRWWAHRASEIVTAKAGAAVAFIGADPPSNPVIGSLWWDVVSGQLFVLYDDVSSVQWVPATNQPLAVAAGPPAMPVVAVGEHPPLPAIPGTLWFCSADGQLYLAYPDVDSVQWVPASNAGFGVASTNIIGSDSVARSGPADGSTVVLTDARPAYVDNSAALAALTIFLPAVAVDTVIEIGFRSPITLLILKDAGGVPIPGAPESAFGPGAAIQMKLLTSGWVYWK